MPDPSGGSLPRFSETFPKRFAAALADAEGAIAGIVASAGPGRAGLIDARALARLHEIYRLRIELEIETAGVLWRTAEVVTAMADTMSLLNRRAGSGSGGAGGLTADEIEARRAGTELAEDAPARRRRWDRFGSGRQSDPDQGIARAA